MMDRNTAQNLARGIEEASLNAWPAMQQVLLDGWILRFSRGFTKRSNAIVPVYPSYQQPPNRADLLQKIRYCENLYAREQLQTVFRLTSLDDESDASKDTGQSLLETLLRERNYQRADPTQVLCRPITALEPCELAWPTLDGWLDVYCGLTGMNEPARSLHRLILQSITGECGFAVAYSEGDPVACGLGVVEREYVGLFDIFTAESARGGGYGSRIVEGLVHWGSTHDAQIAYLQVMESNHPAKSLYERLGFSLSYRYWYRIGH